MQLFDAIWFDMEKVQRGRHTRGIPGCSDDLPLRLVPHTQIMFDTLSVPARNMADPSRVRVTQLMFETVGFRTMPMMIQDADNARDV